MAFTLQIQGLDKLLTKVKQLPKEVQVEISAEMETFSQKVINKAHGRIPVDMGILKMETNYKKDDVLPMTYRMFSNAYYAPYVEFGTGKYALKNQPWADGEVRAYARNFFVNGKGTLPATPFFFNSFFEEKPIFIRNIKNVLKLKK